MQVFLQPFSVMDKKRIQTQKHSGYDVETVAADGQSRSNRFDESSSGWLPFSRGKAASLGSIPNIRS
jgi:hypothetical protein